MKLLPHIRCNRYCHDRGRRWWRAHCGLVLCRDCKPPSFAWLVAEQGKGEPLKSDFSQEVEVELAHIAAIRRAIAEPNV